MEAYYSIMGTLMNANPKYNVYILMSNLRSITLRHAMDIAHKVIFSVYQNENQCLIPQANVITLLGIYLHELISLGYKQCLMNLVGAYQCC